MNSTKEKFRVNRERLISLSLVLLQFVLCLAVVAFAPWAMILRGSFPWYGLAAGAWLGLPCMLLGTSLGLWSWRAIGITRLRVMPEPGTKAQLITNGPYRYVRHPMYTGVLMVMAGLAWLELSWPSGIAWLLLVVVLDCKAKREEHFLQQTFPEYKRYMGQTGRFFPRLSNDREA